MDERTTKNDSKERNWVIIGFQLAVGVFVVFPLVIWLSISTGLWTTTKWAEFKEWRQTPAPQKAPDENLVSLPSATAAPPITEVEFTDKHIAILSGDNFSEIAAKVRVKGSLTVDDVLALSPHTLRRFATYLGSSDLLPLEQRNKIHKMILRVRPEIACLDKYAPFGEIDGCEYMAYPNGPKRRINRH